MSRNIFQYFKTLQISILKQYLSFKIFSGIEITHNRYKADNSDRA